MRTVLQSESAECGLACIAMVAGAHGLTLPLSTLRARFSTSLKGATLKQLIEQAAQLGFAARPVRLELEEIDKLDRPCILHWDLNHFVVLHKVGRQVTVLDPAVGERRMSRGDLSRHFTGVALELTPNATFEPAAAPLELHPSALSPVALPAQASSSARR